jgi:predicted regulator of Ras-like GTPase activity (Roadblock/LC7/MglB family)
MSQNAFRLLLDTLNATSTDICASVLMTKDGLALVSSSQTVADLDHSDEDKISALSASILHLSHKFMNEFADSNLDRVLIKGDGASMLAIHSHELALAVVAKPNAEADPIFLQMKKIVDSLHQLL